MKYFLIGLGTLTLLASIFAFFFYSSKAKEKAMIQKVTTPIFRPIILPPPAIIPAPQITIPKNGKG